MKDGIFNHLNKQQQKAVSCTDNPSIILAGAGSGKTRVLVYKVLYLIKNKQVKPSSIIMITFTNKAANEMKERISKNLKVGLGFVGTFHSLCVRILRRYALQIDLDNDFIIYDEQDQLALIKEILKKRQINKYSPGYFLNQISGAKNQLIKPLQYARLFTDHNALTTFKVYQDYQKQLEKNKALDFDDLIVKTIDLFLKKPIVLDAIQDKFKHFLVDEFQDTNYAQYVLIKLLGEKHKKVTVVGDFSQSIYSWRGADINNLEKFKEDFPKAKMFYLEENYRSTQKILDFAYKVISKNETHPILNLFTRNDEGEEVVYYQAQNEEDEAVFIAEETIRLDDQENTAILYRTNVQSRIIEEVFLHYGIPYILIGGTRFYERKEIKDVLAYLRLLIHPTDQVSLERVKKIGKRKYEAFKKYFQNRKNQPEDKKSDQLMEEIFAATGYLNLYNPSEEEDYSRLENIKELKSVAINYPKLTEFLEQIALVESEYFEGEKKLGHNYHGIKLMTLHQAKGLEFPYVFIVGVEEGILPHARSVDDHFQLEEERRLFYVGVTRAKKRLYITYARRRFIFGKRIEASRSRFLEEVGDNND